MAELKSSLRDKTHELFVNRNRSVTLDTIARSTEIEIAWLRKFQSPKSIKEPSVAKIQKLYEYLTNKTLEV